MCGMSAAFAALFGTPMAAAVFSMEMVSVGDVVEVKVMSVDLAKKRIQLTMILD